MPSDPSRGRPLPAHRALAVSYELSSFVAFCGPKARPGAVPGPHRASTRGGGVPRPGPLETRSWIVQLEHAPSTRSSWRGSRSAASRFSSMARSLAWVTTRHPPRSRGGSAGGAAAAVDLHGSFAALVVDPIHDRVAVVTDRVNSRRGRRLTGRRRHLAVHRSRQPRPGSSASTLWEWRGTSATGRSTDRGRSWTVWRSWTGPAGTSSPRGDAGQPYWQFRPGTTCRHDGRA